MGEIQQDRKVKLTFGGDAFADGRVPLTLLAEKLKALQSLLFHAAATVTGDGVTRRGQWANRYREAVELRFTDSHHSELTIEAELPGVGLFPDDLGVQSLDLAYDFAAFVDEGRGDAWKRVPDRQNRLLLLRTLEQLAPRSPEGYTLTFAKGSADGSGVRISGETRAKTQALIERQLGDESSDLEEVCVSGKLTKIHYETAPEMLSVRVSPNQDVKCFYDESLREQVASLCPGSMVEVIGFAGKQVRGYVTQIDSVKTVNPVSMEPVLIRSFPHGKYNYRLREAVSFNIEFADGVWAYSNDTLGIRGFAFKREDALRELYEAFTFAYHDIGQADESSLIGKAIDMRREFQRLVEMKEGA